MNQSPQIDFRIIENPTFVKCKSGELGCLQVDNNLGGKLLIEGVQKALKVWPEDKYFLPEVGMDDPKVGPPKIKKPIRRDQRSANAGTPAAAENSCNEKCSQLNGKKKRQCKKRKNQCKKGKGSGKGNGKNKGKANSTKTRKWRG